MLQLLIKSQNSIRFMIRNIYSNIKDTDALESFFECLTYCSISSEGIECTTACYRKHLGNISSPDK